MLSVTIQNIYNLFLIVFDFFFRFINLNDANMMMNVLKILMSIFLFFEHSVDNMEDDNEDD